MVTTRKVGKTSPAHEKSVARVTIRINNMQRRKAKTLAKRLGLTVSGVMKVALSRLATTEGV